MSKVYIISDTHFGHAWAAEHRGYNSVDEHDTDLVHKWNSIVTKRDTVWHLGDVFFGSTNHKPLAFLNGYKRLVMGNHDHYSVDLYMRYFNTIHGVGEYKDCVLTHIPVHIGQKYRWLKNIHGHMHDLSVPDPWYQCVSVEQTGLAPILLNTVVDR
jgi:calcineurin-like phosphoesterase family protein